MKASKSSYYQEISKALTDLNTSVSSDLASKCLNGIKKLGLVYKFSQIDDEILDTYMRGEPQNNAVLTEIIYLETNRLRFKEEVNKCKTNLQNTTISKF